MKISFVVPIYKKTPEQLRRCLKSLVEQSHKDIEIIAVFDGKDKDLENIVVDLQGEDFDKNNRQHKFTIIEHGGASKARNEGLKHATGDIISFWDADSYAEPEMADVWVRAFAKFPGLAFVYSGYKWTNVEAKPWDGEPFDPWLLRKYNSVGPGMFPCKREHVVEWDESLAGLQDWDYWRRVVDGGGKGLWLRGYGFATDLPDASSISGQTEKRAERIAAIRKKFNDPEPSILVHGNLYKEEAVRVAKLLDADYFANPYYLTRDYRVIMSMGFHPTDIQEMADIFRKSPQGSTRVIYWMGMDAEQVLHGPHKSVTEWMKAIRESVHVNLCPDDRAQNTLEELGIQATVQPLPRDMGEMCAALPEKFKVLSFADSHFSTLMDSVIKAMPDVAFDIVTPERAFNLTDYTVVLQFCNSPRLIGGSTNALLNGRYVISNVQAPYAGYVGDTSDLVKYKEAIIAKIREYQDVKELNKAAQEHYGKETAPETFRDVLLALTAPKMEVVA